MLDYERGQLVQYEYPTILHGVRNPVGLIVNVEYHVKSDDFIVYIMWNGTGCPSPISQNDGQKHNLRIIS